MSKISKTERHKSIGDHQKYLSRITKTLYYGKFTKKDCLSIPVTELAAELFSEAHNGKSLKRLHYNDAAEISRNACVSLCSLVLATLYLERLKKSNPEYLLKTEPSELFLVSLMVSSKFLFDYYESEDVPLHDWASSGGISTQKLLQLEKNFLNAIDWEVYVNELSFWKKLSEIEVHLAKKQGCARGHFTYTELQTLSSTIELQNILQCIVAVSVILAATYTAGLLTLMGSMFLASQIPGTCLNARKIDNQNQSIPIANDVVVEVKTEFIARNIKLDAVNVLNASIFLASIKSCNNNGTSDDENMENVSWDWWNVPSMVRLAENAADFIKNVQVPTFFDYNLNYYSQAVDDRVTSLKFEAHFDKATKTRIQDQLENSWHQEWIDTIRSTLFKNGVLPYQYYNIYNIKA